MHVIPSDPGRRIALDGVVQPVPRPVDIHAAQTGFTALRTLRIYRFEAGSVIVGHAEEDEVFIIALAGELELKLRAGGEERGVRLRRPALGSVEACVAFLPPQGEYVLTALAETDVAYVRATPRTVRPLATFAPAPADGTGPQPFNLSIQDHAERLRLQLLQVGPSEASVRPSFESDARPVEALIHLHGARGGALRVTTGDASRRLEPGDTLALAARSDLKLAASGGSDLLALCVWAH